eukprot:1089557-Amorphochlora_amoeboformis.AAC.1
MCLGILKLRNIAVAVFFNACRVDVKGQVTNYERKAEDMKMRIGRVASKHTNMTQVLVVFACKMWEKAIYSFKERSKSQMKFREKLLERGGLQIKAGSPFGLVVAQRLRDNDGYGALHSAMHLIMKDMKELGQEADVPNHQNLIKNLPDFISIPERNKLPQDVAVEIILLSNMSYEDLYSEERVMEIKTIQDAIKNGVKSGLKRIRHGDCRLSGKMKVIPSPYRLKYESEIARSSEIKQYTEWRIIAHYKV